MQRSPLVDEETRQLAREAAEAFLRDRYAAYSARVERVAEDPDNRSGADKTWVQRATSRWRRHVRRVQTGT